jgi:hypothetical protein
MGGNHIPCPIGTEPATAKESIDGKEMVPEGGWVDPRPGLEPIAMVARIIARVKKDWDPPSPNTTPWVEVSGATLADVEVVLEANDEWGRGGGKLRSERIPVGKSTNLTVTLHGNLEFRVAKWMNYAKASAAARKEWDRMIGKLKAHEQRHVDIAIEEFDKVASGLIGKDIDQIVPMVTAANTATVKRQKKLDADTKYGSKKSVPCGDVFLDTSII